MENDQLDGEVFSDASQEKIMDDVWRRTVSAIPSEIGKLAYLASLRDLNSGQYHHYGLEAVYSPEDCDDAFRATHTKVFYEWLQRPLADQKDDLEHYFRTVEGQTETILENWRSLEPYRSFLPLEVDAAARQLFFEDLALIIDLMLVELPPVPSPGAWPQQ